MRGLPPLNSALDVEAVMDSLMCAEHRDMVTSRESEIEHIWKGEPEGAADAG
jgi:hypothetical protein